jgi:hypothetical protein
MPASVRAADDAHAAALKREESPPAKRPKPRRLIGRFLLSERSAGPWVPDDIQINADGSCAIHADRRPRGSLGCQIHPDGTMTFDSRGLLPDAFTGAYRLLDYTLRVSPPGGSDLIYVLRSPPPYPTDADIVGVYRAHSSSGDAATELASNHTFRVHLMNLMPDHTYIEIEMDGTYTYTDGVITYYPEHSTAPQRDKYIRDFVIRKEKACLWIVDPFNDVPLCQTPVPNLDLPPPPAGYEPAARGVPKQ